MPDATSPSKAPLSAIELEPFLQSSDWIDAQHPSIVEQARLLRSGASSQAEIVKRCFEFVRDHVKHSVDAQLNPVTCRASDVLQHKTGYCYAKSHLLAALLRANGVACALCYQRIALDQEASAFSWHGLNAVYLNDYGWYRIDARGNKPGVNAQFTPPHEQLAFVLSVPGEYDYPGLYIEPLPEIIDVLTRFDTYEQVFEHLPDTQPSQAPTLTLYGLASNVEITTATKL